MCAECAKDSGVGMVCSATCGSEVKAIQEMVERNRKMYGLAPKTQLRSAVLLAMMAAVFIGFGLFSKFHFLSAYLIAFGVVMLLGASFALLNSRKMAKLNRP
jgi:positive regulator of sigma E activity